MEILFYEFAKRENSTLTPAGEAFILEAVFKDPCSITAPSISINLGLAWNPSAYNYAYIPAFKRYYFVTEWTWSIGLWECSLTVDVLASYKSVIGGSDFYVLRASNDYSGTIVDHLYPIVTDGECIRDIVATNPFTPNYYEGWYILGITGATGYAGSVTYYAMNASQFGSFNESLWASNATWGSIEEVSNEFARAIINPIDYIASVIWLPFTPAVGDFVNIIKIGYWEVPAGAYICPGTPKIGYVDFSLDPHPQAEERGQYLNYSPFTELRMFFPGFGEFPLNPLYFIDYWDVRAHYQVDVITGTAELFVYPTSNPSMSRLVGTSQIGVPVEISQFKTNPVSAALAGVGATIANAANFFGLGADSAAIGSAIEGMGGSVASVGSVGSAAAYYMKPYLTQQYYLIADEYNEHLGRPLMEVRKPESLGGYIQVSDGDITANATPGEKATIKTYLESGFFYE